ncbi:MAG: SpoIID/LytB domain-containing protein [Muribaculaceae bacterium]|nr:SpoIID/LytB domain-containing protein [Muribaculaceae bacterium]
MSKTTEPQISVGIMSAPKISFQLRGNYQVNNMPICGELSATIQNGLIHCGNIFGEEILFMPTTPECDCFELHDVTIGVNFHWERKENQVFRGALKLIIENGNITTVNILSVESYLESVISSEMSATASIALLKAHAVISRSWLLAQIEKNKTLAQNNTEYNTCTITDNEITRWWDREDHVNFDVCADDHCQRYQGITRASTPTVVEAVKETRGEVLMADGKLCDARFSKSCGGVYEVFESCWEPVHYNYLEPRLDNTDENSFPDLTIEENAKKWILSSPEAFCNTTDAEVLSQVLNNYDQETTDFYRWTVEYTQDELKELIRSRSGIDYGKIKSLKSIQRGTSGRIVRLEIVGEKRTMIIGKELEIRRTLSPSHLYSSAFVVETSGSDADGYPTKFTLRGAGWGHGVGLCQIGAAVMGSKGYDYKQILLHYFVDAEIKELY